MSNDDLFKALNIFSQGVTHYQTAQAVNDANATLQQLNAQETDKAKKLQAATGIQNDLSMRLTAAGADPSTIAAATQNIAPSIGAQYQSQENKDLQTSSQNAAIKLENRKLQGQKDIEQMKLDAMGFGDKTKQSKWVTDQVTKFRKENAKDVDAINSLDQFGKIVTENPSQLGVELSKRGLIKATGDNRVSDQDLITADNDKSMRSSIARRLKLEVYGTDLEDKRKFYGALLDNMKQYQLQKLDKKISGYSTSLQELNPSVDSKQLDTAMRSQYPELGQMRAPKQDPKDQIAAAEAWLASPDAKTDPAKAKKVGDFISKLKAGQ